MTEYKPLIYSIGIILFIGLIVPFVLGYFVNVDEVESSPLLNGSINIINANYSFQLIPFVEASKFNLNPISWLGNTFRQTIVDSLTYMSLLPEFLLLFVLILCTISILYAIIKLLPTT